jgi:hypothetical protein
MAARLFFHPSAMLKSKSPVPRKSSTVVEPDIDALAQALADLALAALNGGAAQVDDMNRSLRQALRKKQDEVLYGAIELARFTDPDACRLLRSAIEESAATLQVRKEGAPDREVDAFMVPLFVRSQGGLVEDEGFQDDAAFSELIASFAAAGLESAKAKVVLMRHAYNLDEIDRIAFGDLHDMLREAAASMLDKKIAPTPALERSMHGWTGRTFAPDDDAMELRFLLGFSLKRTDDPFYQPPADEAGADAYFGARMARYQAWTTTAAPVVARCLAQDPARLAIDFLYQDLFYGAKEQGAAELAMLATLSSIDAALAQADRQAADVAAVVAPIDGGDAIALRVCLYTDGAAAPFATVDKGVDLSADLSAEMDELCDALAGLGWASLSIADGFDEQGGAQNAAPFTPAS